MVGMTTPLDPRAVETYRVPAHSLRPGDLVNTAPGGEDDWQRVTAVLTREAGSSESADVRRVIAEHGDSYVYVEMTDIAPVDSNVYFDDGVALVYGTDGDDLPVSDVVSDAQARRNYLYTMHELVTVRRG